MKNKYYCGREVETSTGYTSQYLDADGGITSDSTQRAYFGSEVEAQQHCDTHHESGEVEFVVQSCLTSQ